ncbi:uncharacterized protein MELLADRAFT_104606 [Melampsora larici-populina 98AG31]|uniref:Uncharacterized protein n=1 Tax=Melampsora larici-populina (strain 98AG31 / pathotype 3-4-7) TaxID=747676 RepID=F4RF99_MELLP|nr:uncharacterized protein MELLADRAFT_104606 [Melampsora larici-populina 98AG31]EGG08972.1 hypothetical protein MELLADRAFT_104606 [Melampsora larici-populina 98AG31]
MKVVFEGDKGPAGFLGDWVEKCRGGRDVVGHGIKREDVRPGLEKHEACGEHNAMVLFPMRSVLSSDGLKLLFARRTIKSLEAWFLTLWGVGSEKSEVQSRLLRGARVPKNAVETFSLQ